MTSDSTVSDQPRKVIHVLLEVPETNMVLQEFAIPLMEKHEITICTLYKAASHVPEEITLLEGNGTIRGFYRVLRNALRHNVYDIIHAHTPHVALMVLLLVLPRPRLLRCAIMTIHGSFFNQRWRNKLMLVPVCMFFGRVVCCSKAVFQSFPGWLRWLAGQRMCVVPNGVHVRRIQTVRETLKVSPPGSEFTIASVSRMVPVKNLATTIRAVAETESDHLVFMGDGPLRATLEHQCCQFSLRDRVRFTGLIQRNDVYRGMMQSDLFVSTSYSEGLPLAVLEAMACGCPVLLSDIPPHREIAEGVDFIPLIDPNDHVGFAREINRIRQSSKSEREAVGEKCLHLVTERFSLERMHRSYEIILSDVINSKPRERDVCKLS